MTTSRLEERTLAEAAAAEWWKHEPFPVSRSGVAYACGACGGLIATREGTAIVASVLHCATCTEKVFGADTGAAPTQIGIGPPQEQLPERPHIPEEIHQDAPWAANEPPATAPGAVPVTVPPPKHRPWRLLAIISLALVTVVALVVAALTWAPWETDPPEVPTGVAATSTAASSTINWAANTTGTDVDRYLVLRDGVQVGFVSGDATTFVDEGLTPGETYTYTIVAEGSSKESAPSAAVTTTTPTPSPTGLEVAGATTTAITLRWQSPPGAPVPDQYVIRTGSGEYVAAVPGSVTTHRVTGLTPATAHTYTVAAYWGDAGSNPSTTLRAATLRPPVSAARLAGFLPVHIKVTATGGGTLTQGKSWSDSWTFSPKCSDGACTTVLSGDITPPGASTHAFKVILQRQGAEYTGSTPAHVTHCGVAPIVVDVKSTLTVRVRVTSGHVVNDQWIADSWKGTIRMTSPYTSAGPYYCPAQSVVMTLTGS